MSRVAKEIRMQPAQQLTPAQTVAEHLGKVAAGAPIVLGHQFEQGDKLYPCNQCTTHSHQGQPAQRLQDKRSIRPQIAKTHYSCNAPDTKRHHDQRSVKGDLYMPGQNLHADSECANKCPRQRSRALI